MLHMVQRFPALTKRLVAETAAAERRSINQMVTILVEEALESRGRFAAALEQNTPPQKE